MGAVGQTHPISGSVLVIYSADFFEGAKEARLQLNNGDIYDVEGALFMFQIDPPDNDFQRGFLHYLLAFMRKK